MAKYLATFSTTLNDIEISGFVTMTDKEMESFETLALSITWSFIYQIGEEEIEFESGEDLLSRIDFKEISNEEFKSIKKVFNNLFGTFIGEEHLHEIIGEEIEEIDEDTDDFDEDSDFNDRRKGSKYEDEDDED